MDHQQNPNSPLRDPERLAAEFGLPFRKKKRRWEVTADGFKRTSEAGKGDHARGQSHAERKRYREGYDLINWKDDECPARDAAREPEASSSG